MLVACSDDGGVTFQTPRPVSRDAPIGRPAICLAQDGTPVVCWLESVGRGRAEIRIRSIRSGNGRRPHLTVATVSASRRSGFPVMTATGDRAVLAWTATPGPALRTALIDLRRL